MLKRIIYMVFICLLPLWSRAQPYRVGDLVLNTYGEKGIVFWLHPNGTEGWAVGLQDILAPNGWGPILDIPTLANYAMKTNFQDIDTSGYRNTKIIRDFLGPGNTYPAQVIDFDRGWYIPAREQLLILDAALPFVEQTIVAHGGVPLSDTVYSSTEFSYEWAYVRFSWEDIINGLIIFTPKNTPGSVRPVFTFKTSSFFSDTTLTYLWNTGDTDPVITQQPTETTTYTVEVSSKAGCVATAEKQIFVADGSEQTIHARICQGEVYRENGFEESKAGTYTHTIPGPGGCDVTVTLELTVGEPDTTRLPPAAICEGERYTQHNFDLSEPGEYLQRWQRPGACDSVVILSLSVTPLFQKVLYDTVCYGEAYRENGLNLSRVTTPATHYFTRSASVGCDTSVTLHLSVNPVLRTTLFDTLRFGSNYTENGFLLTAVTENSVYTNTAISSCQCDSVATLYLTVQPYANDTTLYDTLCVGEPYDRYGFHLLRVEADTLLSDTLTNRSGQDSIIYLELTVHQPAEHHYSASVCQGNYYSDNHFTLSTIARDTVCTDTLQTVHGCDSIVYLTLTVHDSIVERKTETICDRELPFLWRDTTFQPGTASGEFRFRRSCTGTGCDSIVYLTLTVHDSIVKREAETICDRELPFPWRDTIFQPDTKSGEFRFRRSRTGTGCDSIVYLTLTVNDSIVKRETETICDRELPFPWRDTTFQPGTKSGVFRFQRPRAVSSCDSIIYLTLTVHDSIVQHEAETICTSELPYTWRDTTFQSGTMSGAFRFRRGRAVTGCDSIVYFTFTVNDSIAEHESETICTGQLPYKWRDTTFLPGTGSGNFRFVRPRASTGCDSIVYLTLTIHPSYLFDTDTTVCPGEQVTFRGRPFNQPGIHTDSLRTAAGCDSLYRLTLRWYPVWEHRDTLTLCPNDTLRWNGQIITAPGTYTQTFSSVHGCDSIEIVEVYPALRFNGALDILLNHCETYTYLFTAGGNMNDIGLHPAYRWEFGDGNTSSQEAPLHSYADSGFYPVTLQVLPDSGCDTTLHGGITVEYYPSTLSLHSDRTTATWQDPEIRFWTDEFAGMAYEWDFGDGSRGTGAETTHRYDISRPQSYTVHLTVTNGAACIVERNVTIRTEPRPTEEYQFPAAFTPNGDGINDTWVIQGLWQAPDNTLEIFNRKEQRVYKESPYRNDWNGTTKNGSILPAGTYIYQLTVGGKRHIGLLTIIRN